MREEIRLNHLRWRLIEPSSAETCGSMLLSRTTVVSSECLELLVARLKDFERLDP
jgi:hypothetical protein